MYIIPNSTIKIYHNVPLNNTYTDTFYFSTITQQNAYFHATPDIHNILKYTQTEYTYQRVNKGKIRVELKADNLYDCNYLAFKNTAYGNKWFYGFITSVEYVNDNVTELSYEIDVMQTYMFDAQLKPCFIERQHSTTDVAGDNILPEPVQIGDITCYDVQALTQFDSYSAVIATADNTGGATGGYRGGLFSGVDYVVGQIDNASQVQTLIDYLDALTDAEKADKVISIVVMPTDLIPSGAQIKRIGISATKPSKVHGYTPKNQKLKTYPYSYLVIDCGNNAGEYRFEWFEKQASPNENKIDFEICSTISSNPQIALVPFGYNGTDVDTANFSEELVMQGFPQCAWSIDAYRAWLAQEASGTAIAGIFGAASIAGGIMSGNAGAVMGGIGTVANVANTFIHAKNRPDQAKGANTGTIDVAMRSKNFYFKLMQISADNAKAIDTFFEMYGYTMNKLGVPNRHARTHWTYTKTRGCVIVGSCPADDVKKMCAIYDNGIRFWVGDGGYTQYFGRYDLSNDIVPT